jgi:hypothetical protein
MTEQSLIRPLLLRSFQNKEESLVQKLEFYFGDPNLNFDHYLRAMIASNTLGHVILEDFLNHVGLSEYKETVIESIPKYSKLLEISSTKKLIYRSIPYIDKPAENCCIFVSEIPIKTAFSKIYEYFLETPGICHIKTLSGKDKQSINEFKGEVVIEFVSQIFAIKFIRDGPYTFSKRLLKTRESNLGDRMKLFGETIFIRNYKRPFFYIRREHSISVYGFPIILESTQILNRIQKIILGIVYLELVDYRCYVYLKDRISDEQVNKLNLETAPFSQGRKLKLDKLEGSEEEAFLNSCEMNSCYFNQTKADINKEAISLYNTMRQSEGFIEEEVDLRNLLLAP